MVLILPVVLAACGGDKPANQESAGTPAPAPVEVKASMQIVPATAGLSHEAAAAGQAAVSSRITDKRESMGEITFDTIGRLGVHPGREASSWVKLDVSGLNSLDLYPAIKSLSPACKENALAGTVNLSVYADDQLVDKVIDVNRNTNDVVQISLKDAKQLRLEVDNQNGSISCDWFVVSFSNVK